MNASVHIRPAVKSDEASLGPLGAALMRQHHDADPRRFILTERPEAGYGRFLASRTDDPDSLVLVAEVAGEVVGYVLADIESTSWRDLRGPCGFIHDIYVDERARRHGTGRELLRAALAWIRSKGMSQVVLWSKSGNERAQGLFAKLGFRDTMVEMTLDQDVSATSD
jgi:ribosomal protein S18 acetylase RimI-like enzyme